MLEGKIMYIQALLQKPLRNNPAFRNFRCSCDFVKYEQTAQKARCPNNTLSDDRINGVWQAITDYAGCARKEYITPTGVPLF
jgi:hypothetical protein